ncbi:MAG: box helicase [Chloroflexi bacterium]|jgi:superfamily II DNA or RNA helicase|nr:box helicase [Chloroflexota bacterium]
MKKVNLKNTEKSEVSLAIWGNDLVLRVGLPGSPAGPFMDFYREIHGAFPQIEFIVDEKRQILRCLPVHFTLLQTWLMAEVEKDHYANLKLDFDPEPQLDFEPKISLAARPYQTEAVEAWTKAGGQGVVVLPTGAGKTFVAALAIARLKLATLVIVPTIDLLLQWQTALAQFFGLADKEMIGVFGGGRHDLKPLTIITYDSAIIHTRHLGRFALLVFDEAHHLPAESYQAAAEGAWATKRLGLSATPERADNRHLLLDHLIGPEIYRRMPHELTRQKFLASYKEQKIMVALSEEERYEYDKLMEVYRKYLNKQRFARGGYARFSGGANLYQELIYRSGRDPQARAALLAHQKARQLSLNAGAKLEVLETLLNQHRDDKVIIFSEFNSVVDEVNRRFFIPSITYKTRADERKLILERFRSGQYTKLVSGRVLNEGVDVPDANIALVISGNATSREYIQRLGRVLRPKASQAILYELISDETGEVNAAKRRRQGTHKKTS